MWETEAGADVEEPNQVLEGEATSVRSPTATADALPSPTQPPPPPTPTPTPPLPPPTACDIFFSFRLDEAKNEVEKLKAMIEHTRPGVRCFMSGNHPIGTNLGIINPTALDNAKMAIIMGSKTYGKETENTCSTYEEMQFILNQVKVKKKSMFLLKMCEEWKESQTKVSMGSCYKFRRWDGQVTQALVDEILTSYDQATVASRIGTPIAGIDDNDTDTFHECETRSGEAGYEHGAEAQALPPDRDESAA